MRPKISGTNGDRGIIIFAFQLTTSRTGNLALVDTYFAICDDHTHVFSVRVMDKTGHSRFHVREGPVTSGSTSETIFFSLCRAYGPFDTYPCLFVCFTHDIMNDGRAGVL